MKTLFAVLAAIFFAALAFAQGPVAPPRPLLPAGAKPTPTPLPAGATAQFDFEIKVEKKISEPSRTLASEDEPVGSDTHSYSVTLTLRGPDELRSATVEYRVFVSGALPPEGSSQPALESKDGTESISSLRVADSMTFTTPSFDIPRSTLKAGYYIYSDGKRTRNKAELAGIWVRVKVGGKVVYERAEPEALKARASF